MTANKEVIGDLYNVDMGGICCVVEVRQLSQERDNEKLIGALSYLIRVKTARVCKAK